MSDRSRNLARLAGLAVLLMALSGCVAGSAESHHAAAGGLVSQLLLGFWHGVIGPPTLIGEVINHFAPHLLPWDVHMYETTATGWAYDVGFYFGLLGGPGVFVGRWRR
ncbi:MAG TPA: hypothetical protein VE309_11200 [Caulobacteraceae bacterium]|nr:hypothetical protein [Caulobacteraceae bacterium]